MSFIIINYMLRIVHMKYSLLVVFLNLMIVILYVFNLVGVIKPKWTKRIPSLISLYRAHAFRGRNPDCGIHWWFIHGFFHSIFSSFTRYMLYYMRSKISAEKINITFLDQIFCLLNYWNDLWIIIVWHYISVNLTNILVRFSVIFTDKYFMFT